MDIAQLKAAYGRKKIEIRKRLDEFAQIRKSENEKIFYELCYCILTANGSAKAGREAQKCLERTGFWKTGFAGNCLKNVRYNENKEKFLLHNRKNILDDGISLRDYLSGNPLELREKIAPDSRHFKGLGWKASSQFLRNAGFRGLAILDRHILKNLKGFGVIREIPKSLTRKKYLEIELKMKEFSERIGIPMDELDILLWTEESGAKVGEAK